MVGGKACDIRTDFRTIIKICEYMSDPDLADLSGLLLINTLYIHPEDTRGHQNEAIEKGIEFIDLGEIKRSTGPRLMDWTQDANLVIPAINKVAGCEVRSMPYIHWWTFIGYYMEIGESTFSTVIGIRSKLATGKKLEKWEREYAREHSDIVQLKPKLTTEQNVIKEEEKAALKALLGE